MQRVSLVAVLTLACAALACDDGSPEVSLVGTLRGDRVLVRQSSFEGTRIDLLILDLKAGTTSVYESILEGDEQAADRERLRGARWKKAEAALKKEGLTLKTFDVKRLPFKGPSYEVKVESDSDPDTGCTSSELVAVVGKRKKVLGHLGYCGSSDTASFVGVALTADGKYLIPWVSSGCSNGATEWLKAHAVEAL